MLALVRRVARLAVADPVARTRSQPRCPVAGIGELAALERETAAPDARCQANPEPLELREPLINPRRPGARQARPLPAGRHPVRRKASKLLPDLLERQPDPLGEHDERDSPEHRPGVAAVARAGPFGPDQAPVVVEPKCRGGNSAAAGDLADGEQAIHDERIAFPPLDFKFT